MTQEDKAALIEFLRGGAVVGIVVGVIFIGLAMLSQSTVSELKPTAEVVDQYKGCDIVRWNSHQLAEYKYFLYCEKNK
jgi:hypothetical protein